MTIIAAASWNGSAWIGCDQAGTDGWGVQGEHGTKLHKTPFGWLGYTASYRTIQVVRRSLLTVESVESDADMESVIGAIERGLMDAGWSRTESTKLPACEDLTLLIVTNEGVIYTVQSDLAYLRHRNFAAVGSGYQIALGALWTAHADGLAPENAVRCGIEAACEIMSSCANPAEPVQVCGEKP